MTNLLIVERDGDAPSLPPSEPLGVLAGPAVGGPSGTARVRLTHPSATSAALEVTGEIDLVTVRGLSEVLLAAVELPRCRELLVDLGGVGFLCAAGIEVFAQAHERATGRGVAMRLVASSRVARRAFQITRSTGCFDTWPSRQRPGAAPSPRPMPARSQAQPSTEPTAAGPTIAPQRTSPAQGWRS